ncbi:MAG: GDSL-type esterase/lipase family protein [Candidatus Melainabacteria bacterium]|nr:GDSL-type esterase/lipase family protein [Candidatus Melainabacteria bacterium]
MFKISSSKFKILIALLSLGLVSLGGFFWLEENKSPAEKSEAEVEKYYQKMHTRIMKRVKGVPIDLLFIGDSITEHWLDDGKDIWAKEYGAWNPGNFGLSGDTTYGVLWRLKQNDITGLKPKVAIVLIGTNDLSVGRGAAATARGIEKIVDTLKKQLPDTTVVLIGLLPRSRAADPGRKLITEVNQSISKLENGTDIRYLDVGNSFMGENGEVDPELMPDGLHLSNKGYRVFADAMKPTLAQYLTVVEP